MISSIADLRLDQDIAFDRADWLIDAIATATQDRKFLRGEPEFDAELCEVIRLNAAKAILTAIEHSKRVEWI